MASSDPKPSKSRSKEKRNRSRLHDRQQQQQPQEAPPPKKIKPSSAWSNLDLILSLQRSDLDDQRKIELASDFVNSDVDLSERRPQPVSVSRLVSFLGDWVQPLLIPKERGSSLSGYFLDYRCWAVLRFCLRNSSVAVSLNLLKSVTQVLNLHQNAVSGKRLFEILLECFELILSANARAFYNATMDVWRPCVVAIVGALRKSSASDNDDGVLVRLSRLLLEHFVNFLRFHKDPTNVFSKFVDGLLEPLLELLVLLVIRSKDGKCGQGGSLLTLVEDVLSNGLFHPANIGGFLSLKSSNTDQKTWAPKGHREFFKKLGNIITEKKAMALWGFGYLFRLFVASAKTQKAASLASKNEQALAKSSASTEERKETSKPLFEVFVQFMQPLVLECKRCSEEELSKFGKVSEDRLLEAHGMLKSLNETLVSFIQEKIYMRTDDTSEGAHYKFLKEVYETIVSISEKVYQLWLSMLDMDDHRAKKMLPLVAREVVAAIGYFLEIEYKVVEDDLVKLWVILFSFLAVYISVEDAKPSSLTSDILSLGCKLINTYSELRQVSSPLFALLKAARLLKNNGSTDVLDYSIFACSSLSSHVYLKSAGTLLCSQEIRAAISNAIKSIPEGQASRCVQQLEVDVADSLRWIRFTPLVADGKELTETNNFDINMTCVDIQIEILGRLLSEVYTTVLDSLTVTDTNSISIGNSIKNLMGTIGLSFSNLVQSQSGNTDEFLFSVTGRRLRDHEKSETVGGIWIRPVSISWVFVFFFRMYISSRSLYHQIISLMPTISAVKAAKSMGSFFIVAREVDWKERPESVDEGYFSWIVKPSISLLNLIKFHLEDFFSSGGCPSLHYVIYIMSLQRLSDLNRLIKAFEFFQGTDLNKSSKKWNTLAKVSKEEATELTNFLLRHVKLLDYKGLYLSNRIDEVGDTKPAYDEAWDLGICSLNWRSLHIAIWRLLCRNIDVWCSHAAKKYLKKFLSCLICYSVQDVNSGEVSTYSSREPFYPRITMHHVSVEFLTNIVSYEQPTLGKHFTSGFGRVLEELMGPILSHLCSNNMDLGSLPDWLEFLSILRQEPLRLDDRIASLDHSSSPNISVVRASARHLELNERRSSSRSLELRTCESLLNLLSKIPKVQLDAKSFSVYAAYVLNIERSAVSYLLNNHSDYFICEPYELLRLFVSCRRAMKYVISSCFEDNSVAAVSTSISAVFGSSESILWLLKSVSEIVELPHTISGLQYSSWVHDVIFPLIDHTSCIFFAVSGRQMNGIRALQINDGKSLTEHPVDIMVEILKEQARNLLVSLSNRHTNNCEDHASVLSCSRLAVNISCFQGFLWGLISAIDSVNDDASTVNPQFSRLMPACLLKLSECIALYEDIINLCLNIEDKTENLCTSLYSLDLLTGCAYNFSCTGLELFSGNRPRTSEQAVKVNDSTIINGNNGNSSSECASNKNPVCKKQKVLSLDADSVANVSDTVCKKDLSKLQKIEGSLLQRLLKGEDPQVAYTLQQLFTASAAIVKLKSMLKFPRSLGLKIRNSKLGANSIRFLLGISVLILREMAATVGRLDGFSFVWLDGLLTFLEVVGSSNADLNLSEGFYSQLIDTHFRAIGKCISLQGKSATLSSHETGSITKMLQSHNESNRDRMQLVDQVKSSINAFKARLRISFKKFIIPSKFNLMTALQSLDRALVGAQHDCNVGFKITTGNSEGGEISSTVAAGIDCLESVLESLSGDELVRGKISSFVTAVFNIVLHLQSPTIFYLDDQPNYKCEVKPDAGSVILMCIEILTNIVGNDSFSMESWHVSQCLHIPMALFIGFHQLKNSSTSCERSALFDDQKVESSGDMRRDIVDRKFSIELYSSCCRLLCTTIKHQKDHVERVIAILEESVSTLLNCLEMVGTNLVREKGHFSWAEAEAIKCACSFRRIYEEIRNEKKVYSEYSLYFLSNYICAYSGCGPMKIGFKREIDEALRPGVYSLIDVCSDADKQRLHTSFGEGPCRRTLNTLLHDYKVMFKYEGKI